ncbi:ATP synthase I chain [Rubidibacter lacunae KORDI 51-2]|uniref:ATP synthase I chain n=1 Tax=Rubidibacter lacunae KORDI 51-2 TaxID=582515 RepID=U5DBB5_9CHRO|nr:ATP synthase I chain [Rubidibacter lacunae]ERN41833.1 ATP synthase I chain [Rubidibacter lacunae KORDI 51-2]
MVNLPETPAEIAPSEEETAVENAPPALERNTMREYYQLQKNLYLTCLGIAIVVFGSVWLVYSLAIALNYVLGACVGVLYLRRLAKDVEQLGENGRLNFGVNRLALLVAAIVAATQLQNLQILPIFLGFLTYKVAILVYVFGTTLFPPPRAGG